MICSNGENRVSFRRTKMNPEALRKLDQVLVKLTLLRRSRKNTRMFLLLNCNLYPAIFLSAFGVI